LSENEIKVSLRTREAAVARIRNLELMLKIERQWAQFDGVAPNKDGSVAAYLEVKGPLAPTKPLGTSVSTSNTELELQPIARSKGARLPVRGLFDSYAKEAELAPSTVKRWTPVIERLISYLGHDDARAILRADLVAWKHSLLREGIANITIRDVYVAATKATRQFGLDQGELEANPAVGVKVRACARARKGLYRRRGGHHPKSDVAEAVRQDQSGDGGRGVGSHGSALTQALGSTKSHR
jgi:hypothetical protein